MFEKLGLLIKLLNVWLLGGEDLGHIGLDEDEDEVGEELLV